MKKTAVSHDILLSIDKSARYIGGEYNSIVKDPRDVSIRFALCFPDVYEIGMSNLGIQILYQLFNKRSDTWCERVFTPWKDLIDIMRAKDLPLFGLESQDPISDFDFIGFSLQYEMCYTNVLTMLDLAKIPLLSKDRDENCPIIVGGGPCTCNPEPIADFFDIIYIGEGEAVYNKLLDLYKDSKAKGIKKQDFLKKAANIPGLYIPAFYDINYKENGLIDSVSVNIPDIPSKPERVIDTDFSDVHVVTSPVIPHIQATQDRMVTEIQRGCIRGCRFCQAGMVYRPNRQKKLSILKEDALALMENTGYDEISLSSLSSSDYDDLPGFLDFLIEKCSQNKINISLPSLRIDAVSVDILKKIGDIRKTSITFAPEAGSQRLRDVINKDISKEEIINGAKLAFEAGFRNIKLYFMLGLPTETNRDILEIADIAEDLMLVFFDTIPKEKRMGNAHITVSTSFFIPKPFTPFQWESMLPPREYKQKAALLKEAIKSKVHGRHISYQWHSPEESILEGIMARGDRKVSKLLLYVYNKGACYDAWSEFMDYNLWTEGFKACDISPEFYNYRKRNTEETLPWDHINIGVTRSFLEREKDQAYKEIITPNCNMECSHCGAKKFQCGICEKERA